jgi:RNA polymerase sigma-70 factor, ECF subfamily
MSMIIDDAATIRAFRHGDDSAFDSVVAEHRQELLRHARRRVPDDATAEDLVQETFVRAYRSFGRLPDDSRVRPWLHQILRNVCIDDSHRRRRELDKLDRLTAEWSRTSVDGPEETLHLDIDSAALTVAMTALPDTHRHAFVQRVVDGLEYDEIAALEGVTEPNARARVSRARSALRRALQGAAAIPITLYLVVRRPGRGALAAPPHDPSAATVLPATGSAVSTASRLATTFAPAMDMAAATASGAGSTVPMLAKAAVGIGAVATMALATGPELPVERPAAIVMEAATTTTEPTAVVVIPTAPVPPALPPSAPAPLAAGADVPSITAATAPTAVVDSAAAVTTAATVMTPVVTTAPATTAAPATTLPPATTTPPETTVASTLPPLTGGTLQASVSVTPAGPRLDVNGSVTLSIGGVVKAGSISGRLGVGDPDPAGSRRLDGTFIINVDGGTIELRLAGYGSSTEAPQLGVAPTTLTMSGVYRASGATGQLATSGSFSGSLTSTTLSLTLSI